MSRDRLADRRWIEGCDLEKHAFRLGSDAGPVSAHDTGKRDRLFRIRDDEIFDRERDRFPIEELKRLSFHGLTHDDSSFDRVRVKRMHRLAELEERVIGDIDRKGNRTETGREERRLQPKR